MRFNVKERRYYTLDEDYIKVWSDHGWEVVESKVRNDGKLKVWTIKARLITQTRLKED